MRRVEQEKRKKKKGRAHGWTRTVAFAVAVARGGDSFQFAGLHSLVHCLEERKEKGVTLGTPP